MERFKEMFQWQTISGDRVTVGDVTVTPQSQALTIRWPNGGLVWNRPAGEPVTVGEYRVITASEVNVGMGFGFGSGGGSGRGGRMQRVSEDKPQDEEGQAGIGGGGGGGGASAGRPVAVISVGPEGVQVEPVVDPTKIALALFTTLGSMFFMLSKMRKASKG